MYEALRGTSRGGRAYGEFCVTVGPVTRTAGILAYSRLKALVAMGPADMGRMLAYLG